MFNTGCSTWRVKVRFFVMTDVGVTGKQTCLFDDHKSSLIVPRQSTNERKDVMIREIYPTWLTKLFLTSFAWAAQCTAATLTDIFEYA